MPSRINCAKAFRVTAQTDLAWRAALPCVCERVSVWTFSASPSGTTCTAASRTSSRNVTGNVPKVQLKMCLLLRPVRSDRRTGRGAAGCDAAGSGKARAFFSRRSRQCAPNASNGSGRTRRAVPATSRNEPKAPAGAINPTTAQINTPKTMESSPPISPTAAPTVCQVLRFLPMSRSIL